MSDTAALDPSYDKSGPAIKELLVHRGFDVPLTTIVPDDELSIQSVVTEWAPAVDWIITSGGTGFGVRDRTPEVKNMIAHWKPNFWTK